MAVSLFASLGAFLGEFLGDPTLARWHRKRLFETLRRKRGASPPLPDYLSQLTPLDGPAPADTPAMRALWNGAIAAVDLPSTGDRALAGMVLYSRGLNLWEPDVARRGLAALLGEAEIGCLNSGIWNEDSTIRHLQMTANYAAAWLLARRHERPETEALATIARAMLAVIPALTLPGGLPAIGDWPDDVDPGALQDLMVGHEPVDGGRGNGWLATLPADDRAVFTNVRDGARLTDLRALEADGWLRVDHGAWSGLWHARPDGWLPEQGCGHHDLGAAELHLDSEPILVDAGGPPAEASPDSARRYRSPMMHGGVSVDGVSPTPVAKQRYDAAFRQSVIGKAPSLRAEFDGASLVYGGFARLGGLTEARRRWSLAAEGVTIDDLLQGTGRRRVERRLVTPLPVTREDATLYLRARAGCLRLTADAPFSLQADTGWTVRGVSVPLTIITLRSEVTLPWQGRLRLSRADSPESV